MTEFKELKLSDLVASSTNPRSEFEENSLKELAESIKAHGVLQPIIARIHPDKKNKYEVVCGERRYRASKIAELKTIAVSIRDLNDDEVFEIQIIENLERKDVHPMDEAIAFQRMLDSGKYAMEDIAAKVAKNVTFVAQRLKLNDLIPELKEDFLKGEFGVGHAVLFARINIERQKEFYDTRDGYANPGYGSLKEVQEFLDRKNPDLDSALFSLEDPKLNPAAGPCISCPKCAAANPVLFPETEENFCYDTICYEKKDITYRVLKLKEILDENPAVLITTGYGFDNKKILDVVQSYGINILKEYDEYNSYGDQKNRAEAFNIKKFAFEGIFLKGSAKSKIERSNDPTANIQEEISNIKGRASRALELDREKIYIRALNEITKYQDRNKKLLNSDPLEIVEKKALALAILSYQDDKWIEEEYGQKLGYNDRHNQLDKIFSDSFLNKLIRNYIQRTLISESIADFEKHDRAAYMHSIFGHYFPKEIELFTLEQTAIAKKRITKSDQRIKVLQDEIDGKIDTVKRCSNCKKSDDDYLEEVGAPAMWNGDLCLPCSVKNKTSEKLGPVVDIPGAEKFKHFVESIKDVNSDNIIEHIKPSQCRVCGCTDEDCSQCIKKTGFACHWVEDDLCSACQEIEDADFENEADPAVEHANLFEQTTRKKKFSLNNSYFKNINSHTEPSTPLEVMQYYKQHGDLPFDMDPVENINWLYETYIEYQKRNGVYNSQFFTPPATADQLFALSLSWFDKDSKILDACSGFGMLSVPFINEGFTVDAFDFTKEMVDLYNFRFNNTNAFQLDFRDEKINNTYFNIISNPPYEIKELTKFLDFLCDTLAENGTAVLLLPKGFVDKESPKTLVWQLERFNIIHREDMNESFARTGIKAEIVVLERN